jgi:hypothetical protein
MACCQIEFFGADFTCVGVGVFHCYWFGVLFICYSLTNKNHFYWRAALPLLARSASFVSVSPLLARLLPSFSYCRVSLNHNTNPGSPYHFHDHFPVDASLYNLVFYLLGIRVIGLDILNVLSYKFSCLCALQLGAEAL